MGQGAVPIRIERERDAAARPGRGQPRLRKRQVAQTAGVGWEAGVEDGLAELVHRSSEPKHLPGHGADRDPGPERSRPEAAEIAPAAAWMQLSLDLVDGKVGGLDASPCGVLRGGRGLNGDPGAHSRPQPLRVRLRPQTALI